MSKKAVFLDRDGTIIKDMVYLNDPNKILIFEEACPAIRRLHEAGYLIIMITNQSGVARGLVEIKNLETINNLLSQEIKSQGGLITDVFYCPHPVDGGCACRKPKPGMLVAAAQKHGIDLKNSWMVGDRMSDVLAGESAGARSILLQNEHTIPPETELGQPKIVCGNLLEAANTILSS